MTIIQITKDPTALEVFSFGQLLNAIRLGETVRVRTTNEQLTTWSPFRVEVKIREMVGENVRVERI